MIAGEVIGDDVGVVVSEYDGTMMGDSPRTYVQFDR